MAFESLPLTIREVRASEDVLKRIYDAARKGLRGDTLARAAGLAPIEYRRLAELDPLADEAAGWGYADAELAAATAIQTAIDAGDAKVALDFLKHRSDWVAKQAISIETHVDISITDALQSARNRIVTINHEPPHAALTSPTSGYGDGEAQRPRLEVLPRHAGTHGPGPIPPLAPSVRAEDAVYRSGAAPDSREGREVVSAREKVFDPQAIHAAPAPRRRRTPRPNE